MVKINRQGCIGCGNCPSVCPEVFEMADDGKASVKKGQAKSANPCVDKAIEECPVNVISK
ncbi:MAG: ferredoxin [Nanoarchaeota archaeon]|nr:ferredoxin [Nanoarchaeota archaeon]